ncbi:MAG: indole-3-glycerol-phosphate synthase [Bacillota bacterium]|nr:indole-3-glycerol-phosphate synthase [Bacillota bacterium]
MNNRFSSALKARKKSGYVPVIPDIKILSPGEGDLLRGRDPLEAVSQLAAAGAPALSVVTEPAYFGGSIELMESIVEITKLPVLRKDFVKSADDLKVTKDLGAEAVLLICAAHAFTDLAALYGEALNLGLEPLVEAHTKEELEWAGKLGAGLVGINNRNILELEKDKGNISTTELLAAYAPPGAVLVSESSIRTPGEVEAAIKAGADAVLVGTALWLADDLVKYYQGLNQAKGQKINE